MTVSHEPTDRWRIEFRRSGSLLPGCERQGLAVLQGGGGVCVPCDSVWVGFALSRVAASNNSRRRIATNGQWSGGHPTAPTPLPPTAATKSNHACLCPILGLLGSRAHEKHGSIRAFQRVAVRLGFRV